MRIDNKTVYGFHKLDVFIKRMMNLGIDIKLSGNVPWVYVDKINGVVVTEKFMANHGFTIGYYPIRKDQDFEFTNISEIFRLIREYVKK